MRDGVILLDIHRLGRTARSGKEGRGLIILAPFEEYFEKELLAKKVPIQHLTDWTYGDIAPRQTALDQQLPTVPDKLKASAYRVRPCQSHREGTHS